MLVVLAHPDDETFGLGGTLALYASQGVKVHLVCATRGEVGTVAPEFMEGYSNIADLRVDELQCAAERLGLEDVYFLDYRDSGMVGTEDNDHPQALAQAPQDDVVKTLVGFIRRLRPEVVIRSPLASAVGRITKRTARVQTCSRSSRTREDRIRTSGRITTPCSRIRRRYCCRSQPKRKPCRPLRIVTGYVNR